jgi:hypothetical protein
MSRDPITHKQARVWQNLAALRGDFEYPYLADAEIIQIEPEPVEQCEPLWQSALVVVIFFAIVAVAVML